MNSKCKAILSMIMMAAILTIAGLFIAQDLNSEGAKEQTGASETVMNYLSPVSVNVFTIEKTQALAGTEEIFKNISITGGALDKMSFVTKLASNLESFQKSIFTGIHSTGADTSESLRQLAALEYFKKNQEKISSTNSNYENYKKTLESEAGKAETSSRIFDGLFVTDDSKISTYLNVRLVPGGEVVGYMYPGTSGHILETKEGWAKITSGSVTGWVDASFLVTGVSGNVSIIVNADKLMLRAGMSTESPAVDVLSAGTECKLISCENDWVYVSYRDMRGYLSADYVYSICGRAAVTLEEQKAAEEEVARLAAQEAERLAAEEAERLAAEEAERLAAEEEARLQAQASQNDSIRQQIDAVYSQGRSSFAPYYPSADELYLMASVIMMEAGYENYQGKLAVGGVIMNRLRSGIWGSSISSIIYAPGQFTGANTGLLASFMAAGPNAESMQAAIEACAGVHNIGSYMYFCSFKSANYGLYRSYVIVDHQVFYQK